MNYYFSRITQVTIILTVLGFLLTGILIFTNIEPSAELPKDLLITDQSGSVVDTLRFHHRTQMLYDSISVGVNEKEDTSKATANHFFFHYNPEFLVWLTLITIMMAIAMGVLPSLVDRLFMLRAVFKINRWAITLILFMATLIGFLFMVMQMYNPYLYTYIDWIDQLKILFKDTWVLKMVILVPTISGLLGLVGMIFISKSIESLKPDQDKPDLFKKNFHILNQSLKFFLAIATILITFAVFTSGALRKAILQEVVVKGIDMIPLEFVYLYGLQFTIVLAIFYLPIYYQLRNKGQVFINNLDAGKNLDAGPEVNGASAKNIEAFMQESAMDTLKIALSILAPLLGSILPDMIHF